jgi:acyl carrier protein
MLRSAIKKKLIKFIKGNFVKKSGIVLNDDTLLVENDLIDSTGVIELVLFIEETFEIMVDDSEITPENMGTINRLVDFVETKIANNQ